MLTESAATGSYLGTLAFFLVITVFAVYINKSLYTGDLKKRTETYVTARNTQGTIAISLSFFASGAGAWVLFTVPEAAILGGPVALIGYILSCLVPVAMFGCIGPYMRRNLPSACTFFEYIQARYGTVVNVYCTFVSLFYMLLYLSAEFTSVGSCVTALSDLTSPLGPVIATSIVTLVYTSIGGLPVSIFTDKVQGVGIFIFTILVCVASFAFYELPTETNDEAIRANWEMVTTWGIGGSASNSFKMAFVLISAVTCANLMHSGFQQRIWAAAGDTQVRRGAIGGILLTIPFMTLFGVVGMIAFAHYGKPGLVEVGPERTYLAFLAAFFLIGEMPAAWQALAIVLAVMLVASSADTLQTGVAALLKPITAKALDFYKTGTSDNTRLLVSVNFVFAAAIVNIPAIVLSTAGVSVLSLFVMADLVCATCVVPLLMGLSDRTHPVAAAAGCFAGLVTALIIYLVGVNGENGDQPMRMLVQAGGLYSDTSLVAFLVVPGASFLATALTNIPFMMKGYRFKGFKKPAGEEKVPAAGEGV